MRNMPNIGRRGKIGLVVLVAVIFIGVATVTLPTNNKQCAHSLLYIKVTEDNQIIENQVFYDIPIGIAVWSSNNRIANCTFINCSDEGILLIGNNNIIENCVFYQCVDGIELQHSSNNIFINCRFLSNSHAGIDAIINSNNNNVFYFCLFYDSPFGCYFKESEDNEFIDCTFIGNYEDIKEV